MTASELMTLLVEIAVAAPYLTAFVLAVVYWAKLGAPEALIHRVTQLGFLLSALATLLMGLLAFKGGLSPFIVELGPWFQVGHHQARLPLVSDWLSLSFAAGASVLLLLVAAFSRNYLHREAGFARFYLLMSLFGGGVLTATYAGSLDLLFFGWEIVGLTSALLIAFFLERAAPIAHSMRALITYRLTDIGLLSAIVWLHHSVGDADGVLSGTGLTFWSLPVPERASDSLAVGVLLLVAAMGKSAQYPFGGWLPRAMEGPTPSSAIFYGALSVHLGPYLLLRAVSLGDGAPQVRWLIAAVGGITAVHATFVARVQTDLKSQLAYATMTQVGLIFVEIALGLHVLALVHMLGHSTLRVYQFLTSPGAITEAFAVERAYGGAPPPRGAHLEQVLPRRVKQWLYRGSLERGFADVVLFDLILRPVLRGLSFLDALERSWTEWLSFWPSWFLPAQTRSDDETKELS